MKLAVCMGYWNGDRAQAQEVIRLAADLLPAKSQIAQLVFVYRHDAKPPDQAALNHAALKFTNVSFKKCSVLGLGHPGGCNAIAFSLFRLMRVDPGYRDCEAFLLLENDCVLTRRNWDVELWAEWERTKAAGKLICGHVVGGSYKNPAGRHVNAAACYAKDIAARLPALGHGRMSVGHDWEHGPITVPVALDSPLFFMEYRKPSITRHELFAPRKAGVQPLVWHGVRDYSAINLVKAEYGL